MLTRYTKPLETAVKTANLADLAYEQLLQDILALDLRPGDVVQERQLAARLDMSRTPIRAALARLTHEGWISAVSPRVLEIKQLTQQDINDFFEMRTIFELRGIDELFNSRNKNVTEALRSLHACMQSIHDSFDFIDHDQQLHALLVLIKPNNRLDELWRRMKLENMRFGMMGLHSLLGDADKILAEHSMLIDALGAWKKKAAHGAMLDHLEATKRRVRRCLGMD